VQRNPVCHRAADHVPGRRLPSAAIAWTRAVLLFATIPVLILKNGIRITTLTLLAIHVDPGFLDGLCITKAEWYFSLGLLMLLPVLWWLQRVERKRFSPQPLGMVESKSTVK